MTAATSPQPFASLNGQRITGGYLTIPYYGNWTAHLAVATADVVPSAGDAVTIALGAITARGTVYRSGAFSGARSSLIRGGYGGWPAELPERDYHFAGGVQLATVLADAATEAGEKLAVTAALGSVPDYVRPRGAGIATLRDVAGSLWWMGLDGTTQVASARSGRAISTPFTVEAYDGGKGSFSIATEAMQDWLPGNTFTNALVPTTQTISTTTIHVDNDGKLRLTVLAVGADDE